MSYVSIDGRLMRVLIIANNKEVNTLLDFSSKIGVSTRTIRNYIKEVNDILSKEVAEIIKVDNWGYKLKIYDSDKFNKVINPKNCQVLNTPEERLKYVMKILIDSKVSVKIYELAEEINVGRTTLVNDIKKLSKLLEGYDLKIRGKQNEGIKLWGNELNIRLFIVEFLKEDIDDWLLDLKLRYDYKLKYEKIKKTIIHLCSNNFSITDETIKEMFMCISVLLYRIMHNKNIETSLDNKYDDIKNTIEYNIAKSIKAIIEHEFELVLNENEILFLTFPLIGRKAPINNMLSDIIINSSVKTLLKEIIDEIAFKFGTDMEYDKELNISLEYHLNFALNRLIFNMKMDNPLLYEIKKCYPLGYEFAKIAAKVIEKKYNLKVDENEIGYMALHFTSFIERSKQKIFSINKVAIVCGTGLGTAQLLYIKLKRIIGEGKIINIFSDIELTTELLDKYDVVFTTVDIDIETKALIMKINAVFDENDIYKEMEKKFIYKYSNKQLHNVLPMVNLVIKEENFFVIDKENYIDSISFISEELIKRGEVDEQFKDRVLERESKAPTSFDNYIALPHALNFKGDRIDIALGTLKKPLMWYGNEVRVIILLMIPREEYVDHECLIKTYEELLKLGQNKSLIEAIGNVDSYEGFKKLLQRELS